MAKADIPTPKIVEIAAGAGYFAETGNNMQTYGEVADDAVFLGAISPPEIQHNDGTEISLICDCGTDISFMPVCDQSKPIQMRQYRLPRSSVLN